jgi:hypothetical protein
VKWFLENVWPLVSLNHPDLKFYLAGRNTTGWLLNLNKSNVIVLGEILEHLEDPLKVLNKVSNHLSSGGLIWITIPINAPAIDHISLFRSKEEVFALVEKAGLEIIDSCDYHADNEITRLIGIFCSRYEI